MKVGEIIEACLTPPWPTGGQLVVMGKELRPPPLLTTNYRKKTTPTKLCPISYAYLLSLSSLITAKLREYAYLLNKKKIGDLMFFIQCRV